MTVRGGGFYVSRDTTEDGGLLLVTLRLLTYSDSDWTEVQASLRMESNIRSKHNIDKIRKGKISWRNVLQQHAK